MALTRPMAGAMGRASMPSMSVVTRRYTTKIAMAAPATTRISSTLTAAMMPRKRLVVPRSDILDLASWSDRTSLTGRSVFRPPLLEGRRLMRARIPELGVLFPERLVQQLPSFVGHADRFSEGRAKIGELAGEVVERRLHPPAQGAALLGEQEISHHSAQD